MPRLLVSTVTALMLSACATPSATAPGPASAPPARAVDYFDFTPGRSWTYAVTQLGASRTLTVTMKPRRPDGAFEDSAGATYAVDEFGVRDDRRYLLRDPLTTGASWTNVVSVSAVEHYQVLGAGQPCQVRGQTFADCVVVESRNRIRPGASLVNELTFARGVGLVRTRVVLEDQQGGRVPQTELELIPSDPAVGLPFPANGH